MHGKAKRSKETSHQTAETKIILDGGNTPRPIQFTRMRAHDDAGRDVRLSKLYRPHPTKGVEKIDGTKMYRGTFEVVTIDTTEGIPAALTACGQLIDTFKACEAAVLSKPINGLLQGNIVTTDRYKEGNLPANTITRSLDDFDWPDGPALLLLDADDSNRARDMAIELYPAMANVAMLVRPSASSSVINPKTNKPLKNSAHGYVVVDDPSLATDCLDALLRLSWCVGSGEARGWLKLSRRGDALTRGAFDASVGSAERLSYEGEPTLEGGLKRLPRTSVLAGDGDGMLNAADLIAFADTFAPEARFNELVAAAKNDPKFLEDQAAQKAAYREEHITELVKRGKTREQAAEEFDRVANTPGKVVGHRTLRELEPGTVLYLTDGTTATVEDVQRDPWAFVGKTCADPIEGLNYPSKSCGWFDMAGDIIIYSHAHGGALAHVIPIDLSKTVFGDALRGWFALNNIPLPISAPKWRERYKNYLPKPSLENARLAIQTLGLICRYNEFSGQYIFDYKNEEIRSLLGDEIGDLSVIVLRQMLSATFGFDFTEKHVYDAARTLALARRFNPVVDLLAEAEANWDGKARLDRFAAGYLNGEDTPLNAAFGRKLMIAGVARARTPGCKFDTITVLESKEGWNKSTAWRVLAMRDEWFSDAKIIGKEGREVQEQLGPIWFHENADLAGMKKAEVETVKEFASRQDDRARPAYGHFVKRQPRHSIEVGTTNADTYLLSQTGNRRFWPIKVLKEIDIDELMRDRMQLWGEAAHYQSQRESLVLDRSLWAAAAVEQEARRVRDSWEDTLAHLPPAETEEGVRFGVVHQIDGQERVSTFDLIYRMLQLPAVHQTQAITQRLSTVMRVLGWQRAKNGYVTIDGRRVSGYFRPIPEFGEGCGEG
jgi:hypothetical protein